MSYDLKDSGEREQFGTGAVRDVRAGKGRYDLISFLALGRIAGVYERGAQKYADRNWEQGIPISRNIDSALRHVAQFMTGEDDEDHLAQAAWNLIAALHFDEGIKRGYYEATLDDRPHYGVDANSNRTVRERQAVIEGVPDVAGRDVLYGMEPSGDDRVFAKPMPEVQYSSAEQFRTQTVMHDPNHSEAESVWHEHPEGLDGPAYPSTPSALNSHPHRHKRAT